VTRRSVATRQQKSAARGHNLQLDRETYPQSCVIGPHIKDAERGPDHGTVVRGNAPSSASYRCLLTTGAYSGRVPTHDGCLLTTDAYIRRVPTHDGCLLTTGAYSRRVPTHDGCLLTTGAYSRQVRTHDRCVLVTGAYSRQVCTRDRCVLSTGVYLRQVCTRDSVDPSSLQASTVDSRQKVVPLIFEVAPLFKTVNASSSVLTTTRPTLLCTPAQAESAIEHVAGACSF